MPKISIIMPIYNGADHLDQSLSSAMAQTEEDIEIICVDDCSTDDTYSLLETYAAKDNRVKLIRHPRNKGTLQARRSGVLAASGTYIMFLDADDALVPEACNELYEPMQESQADVLQFGTQVVKCGNMTREQMSILESSLTPSTDPYSGREVLLACFMKEAYSHTLWNKIYKTRLLKKVYARIEDGRRIVPEDLYAYFIIAYYYHFKYQ
jgi:glycosyltransferase involved in cell wall biosynthesis